MGRPLVEKLSKEHTVHVTTRRAKASTNKIKYLQGNATQIDFIEELLAYKPWDCIVDFMIHTESNLKIILPKIIIYSVHIRFVCYGISETQH